MRPHPHPHRLRPKNVCCFFIVILRKMRRASDEESAFVFDFTGAPRSRFERGPFFRRAGTCLSSRRKGLRPLALTQEGRDLPSRGLPLATCSADFASQKSAVFLFCCHSERVTSTFCERRRGICCCFGVGSILFALDYSVLPFGSRIPKRIEFFVALKKLPGRGITVRRGGDEIRPFSLNARIISEAGTRDATSSTETQRTTRPGSRMNTAGFAIPPFSRAL